jgi:hypothetical protein
MECAWKPNWETTKGRFVDWWEHRGLLLGMWGGAPASKPQERVPDPGPRPSPERLYTDAKVRALRNHYDLSRQCFPAEVLPIADTNIGPGSLALMLGSEANISPRTVWYEPCISREPNPERLPPLRFDPDNRWWKITEATLKEGRSLAEGRYLVGCPDLIENIDILASLREISVLLLDMIERPEWVCRMVAEINRAWFDVYDRIYEIIKLEDGSSTFGAFCLWGPGKVAKVQCDACAMFSPDMFRRFVVPGLTEQCEWLDFSMYHLDGTQCIPHLDLLLQIDALDAIEWTPQAGLPGGGSPRWHDMYRRILNAGKSLQVVSIRPDEVVPLLDVIGGKGVYILTSFENEAQAEDLIERVRPYR